MSIPVGIKIHTVPYICRAALLSSYPSREFLWARSQRETEPAGGLSGLFGLSCLFG